MEIKTHSILALGNSNTKESAVAESLATPVISVKDALVNAIGEKYEDKIVALFNDVSKLDLPKLTVDKIRSYGFTPSVAKKVFGVVQFAIGVTSFVSPKHTTIRSPQDAAEAFSSLQFEAQEHFAIMGLNTKNQVVFRETVFVGSLNASIVHPRELFNRCFAKAGVTSIVVCHQHPSGIPTPSPEDIDVTMRLYEAGKIVGIDLLDHLIIGDGTFLSMKEKGYF